MNTNATEMESNYICCTITNLCLILSVLSAILDRNVQQDAPDSGQWENDFEILKFAELCTRYGCCEEEG